MLRNIMRSRTRETYAFSTSVYTREIHLVCFQDTVYPTKYAHGFVVLCFVVVMQYFIMNSHEVFIHIPQGCFAHTGAIVRLPQCQWSKPDGYGKISQCITTTKHSKAKTVCIFLGIYCISILKLNVRDLTNNLGHSKTILPLSKCCDTVANTTPTCTCLTY